MLSIGKEAVTAQKNYTAQWPMSAGTSDKTVMYTYQLMKLVTMA